MSKRTIWGLSGLALIAAIALGAWWFQGRAPEGVAVRVATVAPMDIEQEVYTTGTVIPNAKQEIYGLATGKVSKVFVKVGDKVTTGQTLVQMDNTLADAQVAQAQAAVNTAQSNLSAAKENLEALKQSLQFETKAVSPLEGEFVSSTKVGLKQAELAVTQAEGMLRQAKEGLKVAQAQKDQSIFKASINGTVLEINTNTGSLTSYNAPLMVVADLSKLRVESNLNEVDSGRVKVGQKVEATSRSVGNTILNGKVSEIAPEAVSNQSLQGNNQPIVRTVMDLDQVPANLKPGFTVNLTILVGKKEGVLAIPQEAIFQENNKTYCYRVVNNTVEKAEVKLGIMSEILQEITSGLKAGEQVVLSPSSEIKAGTLVHVESGSDSP